MSYDKNGNITTLQRTGNVDGFDQIIDDLTYDYKGNQLQSVTDADHGNQYFGFVDGNQQGNDYQYDMFGNMTQDLNKEIEEIKYNHLNLPTTIIFANGGVIAYLYDAMGVKVRKYVHQQGANNSWTDYLNGFQYSNEILQFFPHAEGYVQYYQVGEENGNTNQGNDGAPLHEGFSYVYQFKDHLGNNRLNYTLNREGTLSILSEDHYYPFGMKHPYNNDRREWAFIRIEDIPTPFVRQVPNSGYQYKFLGQERQDELGINWDTFRYRNYDYAIGRFMGIDPITEEYFSISPYQFAHNSPIWKIELEGLEGIETSGTDVINREPRVLAVFYHGGPFGDGNIRSTTEGTGGTGDIYNATAAYARSQGMEFKGAIISPSATQGPGVETGKTFLENNYRDGDTVIIYGYSYGGDNAVNLAEAVPNIPINTMIIVDSSDGPFRGLTVDTSIPNNVDTAYNFYQDGYSGNSNASSSSLSSSIGSSSSGPIGSSSGSSSGGTSGSSGSSSSQSSNSPGSRGLRHTSEGTAKVTNIKISGSNVTHGNIQTRAGNNIQSRIKSRIDEASH